MTTTSAPPRRNRLAGILSVVLRIVFVVAWIVAVTLPLVFLAYLFQKPILDAANQLDGVDVTSEGYLLAEMVTLIGIFIGAVMFIVVSSRLISVLKSIRAGQPFAPENGERFMEIAKWVFFAEVAKACVFIAGGLIAAATPLAWGDSVSIELAMTNLLGAGIALVLAEVFREGARLREEQELTV